MRRSSEKCTRRGSKSHVVSLASVSKVREGATLARAERPLLHFCDFSHSLSVAGGKVCPQKPNFMLDAATLMHTMKTLSKGQASIPPPLPGMMGRNVGSRGLSTVGTESLKSSWEPMRLRELAIAALVALVAGSASPTWVFLLTLLCQRTQGTALTHVRDG
jgi:hypothetical protein